MTVERQRIVDDLAGLLAGELRCDPLTVSMFSSDGSLYQIPPLGVVYPRQRQDVETVVKYCHEMRIPVFARGAGSGIAGESLGAGLLIDFSRHMRRVLSIHEETIRVQPGLVLQRLNTILRPFERYFPPDPARYDVTTIGSMLAVDAAGSHALRVGSTRDHVLSLETILGTGECLEFADEALPQRSLDELVHGSDGTSSATKRSILSRITRVLHDNAELIREYQPSMIRNRCGYYLRNLLSDNKLHSPRLLVGSEGTLGIFTAATLHTAPLPSHRGLLLLLFGSLESAGKAVQTLSLLEPSACDLLDRRLLSLAREADERFAHIISPNAEAALLVEQIGFSEEQARDRIRQILVALRGLSPQPVVAQAAFSFEEVEFLWSLPHKVVPLLARLQGATRPLPFIEDIAVPPEQLHEFLVSAQNIFKSHHVTASMYAHAATGQLHLRPFLPPPTAVEAGRLEALAQELYQAVFAVGGTISGEHAAGLSRTQFIPQQYGPLYQVFEEIKRIFDPDNQLNPGKIINYDPHQATRNLRSTLQPVPQLVNLQLNWTPAELAVAATRCNGCGSCRTQDPGLRMCPVFRLEPREEASPRAKANLMRSYLEGDLREDDFTSPEMKQVANLCFNCKQCQLECPSAVNIPQMMIEAKAEYVAANGLSRSDWFASRAHAFGGLAAYAPWLVNGLLSNSATRWMLERFTGIARQRKLPRFAARTFLQHARRELLTRPVRWNEQRAVVYFVDHYANWHDPQLGRALVAVLRHHGVLVYVPPGQMPSGMALISAGDLEGARRVALQNIKVLADFAREGIPIVCTEPAAVIALRQEYPQLVDHPDVKVIADNVLEAGEYLQQLRAEGKFRTDFRKALPIDIGYHEPCHLRALGQGTPLVELLRLIPDMRLHTIERGCSGMAGAYGLSAENFRNSIRIGWGLISRMRQGDLTAGATECSSCKIQMEQGTSTPTFHPLKLLAWSYGLMPELAQKFQERRRSLFVS